MKNSTPLIYFFDMDHTLIDNDCDVSWKHFLIKAGLAPADVLEQVEYYYQAYVKGELAIDEFMHFQLAEFVNNSIETMYNLAEQHFEQMIKPKIYPEALQLINDARSDNTQLALLTSTNTVVAAPLAKYLKIDLLGTELVIRHGKYTGEFFDPYCAGPGKVDIAAEYCRENNCLLSEAAYFGDSINDKFLLAEVGYPTVVNPDHALKKLAVGNHWNILHFSRLTSCQPDKHPQPESQI